MAVKSVLFRRQNFLILLLFVLSTNIMLYYTAFGKTVLQENAQGIVIGSMIDLALVTPLLFIAWKKEWHVKNILLGIAAGLVCTRILIPIEYLQPFVAVTWVGFLVEGVLVLFELSLLFMLVRHMPSIIRSVKKSSLPILFSFSEAVDTKAKSSTTVIKVICMEILMFYYAFGCWGSKPIRNENTFTLYKKSSLIALYMMLIHSILLETIAIHWWLHAKFPIISIILFILNIYSILFLIGNLQAIRHNAVQTTKRNLYLSFGLMKRMKIDWPNIAEVIDDPNILQGKLSKDTIDFIVRDLEIVAPHVILKLREPTEAIFPLDLKKSYKYVAIRVDEPNRFKGVIKDKVWTR